MIKNKVITDLFSDCLDGTIHMDLFRHLFV